jgi:hypothetical protein
MFCLNTCVAPASVTSPANLQCSLSCTTSGQVAANQNPSVNSVPPLWLDAPRCYLDVDRRAAKVAL